MTLPASVRVNTSVPFPALVTSDGPITVTKNNGIWRIGFTASAFGPQVPPSGNYPTDFLFGWDSVNKAFFSISITNLIASLNILSGAARNQRYTTVTPIVVAGNDQIISCRIPAPAACTLPSAAGRLGVPLTFKDLGQAGTNNITITPLGGDTIDGSASPVVIKNNYGWATLVPFNDGGANTGWMIQ